MGKKNQDKVRVNFRKNRATRTRGRDLTRDFTSETLEEDSLLRQERISGKGDVVRQRTIVLEEPESPEGGGAIRVGETARRGLVVRMHGLNTFVEEEGTGVLWRCAVRRLLKSLTTEDRHVVAVGDFVQFRPSTEHEKEGFIERIEPRFGCLCRKSWKKKHVLVANVNQMTIVTSLAQPGIKWNLIDRMLITSEKMGIRPIVCINKIDLGDLASIVPMMGVYGRMGYEIIPTSARTGIGIERLRDRLNEGNARSVVVGQSGVGKSSLLNAVDSALNLSTARVSDSNEKGRHTTTSAELLKLSGGGYVVDTPGIRQFDLWDVVPEEVEGFFRDIAPFAELCYYPNCTHTHESDCAVCEAVEVGMLDEKRFENFLQITQSCTTEEF
ncbi:MAG: ribosome small subunit-dependent GTPase A [Planctomycetia bacterium]|nr:ribosome small subunit-dependent GTPase A [Planctomycetia bacterium]